MGNISTSSHVFQLNDLFPVLLDYSRTRYNVTDLSVDQGLTLYSSKYKGIPPPSPLITETYFIHLGSPDLLTINKNSLLTN